MATIVVSSSASSSSSYLIHRNLFRPPSIPPSSTSSVLSFSRRFSNPSLSLSSPFCSLLTSQSQLTTELSNDESEEDEHDSDVGEEVEVRSGLSPLVAMRGREPMAKLPDLTAKEKKELASYAHSLGKKLKSQQVGKSGVTDSVVTALIETLEANELLKLKIHGNCPEEMDDAVKRLEEGTGSVMVSRIGRTVIIYRPSLTKLKVEEKKQLNQIAFQKKRLAFKSYNSQRNRQKQDEQGGGGPKKVYGRGRRGSSRLTSSSSSSSSSSSTSSY